MKANFRKAFFVFRKNYQTVPLEIFQQNAYKTLISTVLSARTKDEVTLAASKRLFKIAPNVKKLRLLQKEKIEKLIFPVGFYRTKAKHLITLTSRLLKEFKGKIPNNRQDLLKLPGVGRKTANLVLSRAFGKSAISVDTHVHKISNILGWVSTKTPEKTETELMKILPKQYWREINRLLVSIGRQYTTNKKLSDFLKKEKLI